ncbi:MAG: anti-sigma factor [Sulfitobacter sp.]
MSEDVQNPAEDDDFLAVEYVLGLSDSEALEECIRRLRSDSAFAARVAGWQERCVAMTDDIAPVAPRKKVKQAILAELFPKKSVPLLDRLWVWKGFTIASLVLAGYVAFPTLRPSDPVLPDTVYATQLRGDSALEVLAVLDPAGGEIALRRLVGEAPDGRVLELWAILPDQAPISLGVIPQGEAVRVALPEALGAVATQITLAITDEPPGGAPNGAPTGSVMAAGAVSEL